MGWNLAKNRWSFFYYQHKDPESDDDLYAKRRAQAETRQHNQSRQKEQFEKDRLARDEELRSLRARVERAEKAAQEWKQRAESKSSESASHRTGAESTRFEVHCPKCQRLLRIDISKPKRVFHCADCQCAFKAAVSLNVVREKERPADHKTLGTTPEMSDNEIKQHWREMIRKYHPDQVANLGEEIKSVAERMSKEINVAYERIAKARGLN